MDELEDKTPYSFEGFLQEQIAKDPTLRQRLEIAGANIDIACQLFWLREKNGWTQEQLAVKTGLSQSNISRWETPGYSNYSLNTLRKLATAFQEPIYVKVLPNPPQELKP